MSDIIIWHNPRCTKSRQTLALLQEKGFEPSERHYLKDIPDTAELKMALSALGLNAIDLIRKGEAVFKELELSAESGEDALIAAMAEHPKLIERPIVFYRGKARIGRPPESVLELF